jgi:hypothetical protein
VCWGLTFRIAPFRSAKSLLFRPAIRAERQPRASLAVVIDVRPVPWKQGSKVRGDGDKGVREEGQRREGETASHDGILRGMASGGRERFLEIRV